MPFGFQSVQTHSDILNVLARAQAQHKEVAVSRSGRVTVEGWWGRRSRTRLEAANGTDWAVAQQQQRHTAIATSLKNAIARQGIDVDTVPQAERLKTLLNAVPTKSTLPGVKLFSEGVRNIFPEFRLKDPSLDRLRPEDIERSAGADPGPLAASGLPARSGASLPLPRVASAALANPDTSSALLPANLKKVHDNLAGLMRAPQFGMHRAELGQRNRFQFETANAALGQHLPATLDRSKTYLYVIGLDPQGKVHLRLGFEHDLGSDPQARLGHPSMTQDLHAEAKAIIGGELRYNFETSGWELDDNSGRYGHVPEHILTHVGVTAGDVLQYAAFRFEAIGFRLSNITSHYTRQSMV